MLGERLQECSFESTYFSIPYWSIGQIENQERHHLVNGYFSEITWLTKGNSQSCLVSASIANFY